MLEFADAFASQDRKLNLCKHPLEILINNYRFIKIKSLTQII